jgi:hypothetical protein
MTPTRRRAVRNGERRARSAHPGMQPCQCGPDVNSECFTCGRHHLRHGTEVTWLSCTRTNSASQASTRFALVAGGAAGFGPNRNSVSIDPLPFLPHGDKNAGAPSDSELSDLLPERSALGRDCGARPPPCGCSREHRSITEAESLTEFVSDRHGC